MVLNNYADPRYGEMRPNVYQAYQQMPMQPQAPQLKGRYVSSIEEVRAAQIDFDGSLNFYPDIANQCIYTKQINTDGTALLKVYKLVNDTPQAPNFVTKEEFETVIAQIKNSISGSATNDTVAAAPSKPTPAQNTVQKIPNF